MSKETDLIATSQSGSISSCSCYDLCNWRNAAACGGSYPCAECALSCAPSALSGSSASVERQHPYTLSVSPQAFV